MKILNLFIILFAATTARGQTYHYRSHWYETIVDAYVTYNSGQVTTFSGSGDKTSIEGDAKTIQKWHENSYDISLSDSSMTECIAFVKGDTFRLQATYKSQPAWRILKEQKQIGTHFCTKAEWLGPSKYQFIAWFDSSIPLPIGPQQYWGLPGQIIYVGTESENIYFELVGIVDMPPDHACGISPAQVSSEVLDKSPGLSRKKLQELAANSSKP